RKLRTISMLCYSYASKERKDEITVFLRNIGFTIEIITKRLFHFYDEVRERYEIFLKRIGFESLKHGIQTSPDFDHEHKQHKKRVVYISSDSSSASPKNKKPRKTPTKSKKNSSEKE